MNEKQMAAWLALSKRYFTEVWREGLSKDTAAGKLMAATCPHCTAMAESARLAEDRLYRALEGVKKLRAENERLEALLRADDETVGKAQAEFQALRAKRDRLQEALKRYVDEDDPCEYGGLEECPGTPTFAPCRLHQARAALAPGEESR